VILVYTLPPALLMPWWARPFPGLIRWIGGLVLALALGTAIGLAWAVPAGLGWGIPHGIEVTEAYRQAIWWGQTAGRLSESFAHARSFWWYLPLLPILLFPWLLWPRALRGLAALWRTADPGLRLCVSWGLPTLVILSFISGKQPHYLLPMFPAFALAVAATLPFPEPGEDRDLLLPAAMVAALGVVLLLIVGWIWIDPEGALAALHLPSWGQNLPLLLGGTVLAAGAAVIRWRTGSAHRSVVTLSGMTLAVVALIHIFAVAPVGFAYNLQPTATYIKEAVREGRAITIVGKYHGQLHFLGRLDREVFLVMPLPAAVEWGETAVRGRIVMVSKELPPEWMGREHWQMYRGRYMTVWRGATLAVYDDTRVRSERDAAAARNSVTAP
jgi:4-amino-4-deoxy-L-arabinose transferase-like glycosyltransferase